MVIMVDLDGVICTEQRTFERSPFRFPAPAMLFAPFANRDTP